MNEMIKEVSLKLQERQLKISFAESCTGGALVSALVSVPGASSILEDSYITYSDNAKKKVLNVKQETIDKYTVYSKEVAFEMCKGLFERTNSDICITITGHAGGSEHLENGVAYLCIKCLDKYYEHKLVVEGDRETVRTKFVTAVFELLNQLI